MRTIMFQLPCFYYYYTPCLVTPGPVSPRSCEGAARGKSWKDCHSLLLGSFWAYACNMARIPLDIARSTITTTDISHHGLLCADRKASHQDPLGASFPFLLHPFQSCEVEGLRSGGHAGSLGMGVWEAVTGSGTGGMGFAVTFPHHLGAIKKDEEFQTAADVHAVNSATRVAASN